MKTNKRLKEAFTLIELLVVISIIGVLTTLVFSNLNAIRERARDTQRKSDLKQYQTALETYANKSGVSIYPTPAGNAAADLCVTIGFEACPEDPQYDASDPLTSNYKYKALEAGLNYILWSELETSDYYWSVCSDGRSLETTNPSSIVSCSGLVTAPTP